VFSARVRKAVPSQALHLTGHAIDGFSCSNAAPAGAGCGAVECGAKRWARYGGIKGNPMAGDCYGKHGTPEEQRYPCIDGQSRVCPRCCVERCPVETPELFAACAAAGHPTWPAVGSPLPRKLICLECAWDESVFHTPSVKGFLEALGPLVRPPLRVAHRFIDSAKHLARYTRHPEGALWTDPHAWDAPIFYLAFHGAPGAVQSTVEPIDGDLLCQAFSDYGGYDCLIYFSACSVLRGTKGRGFARRLLDCSGARAVIGYTTDVAWIDSLIVDLLFLHRFYSHDEPWEGLSEIFASVKRDFKPARRMGYTLVLAPEA
jgi:hypothetical protein